MVSGVDGLIRDSPVGSRYIHHERGIDHWEVDEGELVIWDDGILCKLKITKCVCEALCLGDNKVRKVDFKNKGRCEGYDVFGLSVESFESPSWTLVQDLSFYLKMFKIIIPKN